MKWSPQPAPTKPDPLLNVTLHRIHQTGNIIWAPRSTSIRGKESKMSSSGPIWAHTSYFIICCGPSAPRCLTTATDLLPVWSDPLDSFSESETPLHSALSSSLAFSISLSLQWHLQFLRGVFSLSILCTCI